MKGPAFFLVPPEGAYSTPHAAPRFNEATGACHAAGCRCEKCCPGSGCACYACKNERRMRIWAVRRDTVSTTKRDGRMNRIVGVTFK